MIIEVDADDPTPPFEQIRASLAGAVGAGRLAAGHRLPPIRQLAADPRVAPGTVARAYREPEHAGLVETRRALGTTVRSGNLVTPDPDEAARTYVEIVRHHLTLDEAIDAVRAAWKEAQ